MRSVQEMLPHSSRQGHPIPIFNECYAEIGRGASKDFCRSYRGEDASVVLPKHSLGDVVAAGHSRLLIARFGHTVFTT